MKGLTAALLICRVDITVTEQVGAALKACQLLPGAATAAACSLLAGTLVGPCCLCVPLIVTVAASVHKAVALLALAGTNTHRATFYVAVRLLRFNRSTA